MTHPWGKIICTMGTNFDFFIDHDLNYSTNWDLYQQIKKRFGNVHDSCIENPLEYWNFRTIALETDPEKDVTAEEKVWKLLHNRECLEKQYIKQMKKDGCIFTDKGKFVELFFEFIEKFEIFKKKDISNYRQCLSFEDFKFFEELQSLSNSEFEKINLDYKYLSQKIKEINLKKNEDKYDFIKLLFSSKSEYKKINKKEPDLKARNEIIDLIIDRFKENKK